jgi:tetraacyldisaccharide 4'-kinase
VRRLLAPAAWVFRAGVSCRSAAYRRGWLKTRHLHRPVVSVGNLTTGGTGKTPFVAYLAERLLSRGRKPAILTRGYCREKDADIVIIEPARGRAPDPRQVGDEPAMLARQLPDVPIIVSRDRYRAGLAAEERFEVDAHILDDGFQHLRLARTLDIVLLDATEDYDAGLLPAGRLREPLSALARAHVVVLTRTLGSSGGPSVAADAQRLPLEERVAALARRWAPQARAFRADTELAPLRGVPEGVPQNNADFVNLPSLAFCGVGNPQAFFQDLRSWGFHLVGQKVFSDHHRYSQEELTDLGESARALGAQALLTTEKDAMNLFELEPCGLPILACSIAMHPGDEEAFEEELFSRLGVVPVKTR